VSGYDAEIFDTLAGVEERSFWFRSRNRLIVQLAAAVSAPGDRYLEIGCGSGYVLEALVRDCGLEATGSELFAEGLEYARQRVPEADFAELDARSMPYDGAFDLVGAFDVIEHIDEDVDVLRGLRRALRPGGHVLLTVPQHPRLWSRADVYAHHVRRYRRRDLVQRVGAAGFEVLRTTSFVTSLLPAMALSRLRGRLSRKPYEPVAELVPPEPLNRVLEWVLDAERALIDRGLDLPAGGSLALVARRPEVAAEQSAAAQ
jgi:SAM-dependent methyltransferase